MKTKAALLTDMGKPRPYAESVPLSIAEVDLEEPGPGEVLVKVVAASLCHSDLSVVDGSRPRPMPMVLGHEACGIVGELGPDVTAVQEGDHVVFSFVPMCGHCFHCATGRPALCEAGNRANAEGTLISGARRFQHLGESVHHHLGVSAFSQYTVVAQESLIPIDRELPVERAALFGCAVLTGVGAVINTVHVSPGMAVAVFGLGGVGLSAVMGAAACGAYPIIAVDLINDKLELGRQFGATHTVNASHEEAVEAVRALTGGGAGYAFEAVGNAQVMAQAYEATVRGGTTVSIGLPHPEQRLNIPAVSLAPEERTVKGSYMGSSVPRRDLPRYIALYQAGKLPVDALLTRIIHLEEINEAFDALANGEVVRQVVRFDSEGDSKEGGDTM